VNSGGQTTDEPDTDYQILAYLHANPEAQDTLEGIVEWWLLDQKISRQTERVKQTLAELTERGLIVARIGTDSRVHYGIERNKLEEIESVLKNWPRAT
jgi:plasmid stabilization system protein ParE